jgi:hypothetical protein
MELVSFIFCNCDRFFLDMSVISLFGFKNIFVVFYLS